MTALRFFLWAILPYIAGTLFIAGCIWRWRNDKFGWTTRSSQPLESKWLKWASPLFHFGIIFVLFGHIMGLLIPKGATRAMGLNDHVYHLIATIPGTIAGIATVLGLVLLLIRRFTRGDVLRASTRFDKFMYTTMSIVILFGFSATLMHQLFGVGSAGGAGYDYRETISPWLRSLFTLNPQWQLMEGVPALFQIHIVLALVFFMIFPFTRLVHSISGVMPIVYTTRPYIVYRSRDVEMPATQAPKRGWEPVGTRDQNK